MSELRSRALLARLVGFATVSRDSNLALIEFVRDYLHSLGVSCELIYNAEQTKANLLASIGPAVEGGIVLSGHTDVVPVDGQPWTLDPFSLTERDGKLYGRGTADMKVIWPRCWPRCRCFSKARCAGRCTWRSPMTRRSVASACAACWKCCHSASRSRRCA